MFEQYSFIPGEDHSTPAVIEFIFTLPPRATLSFTIQFEKAFLHWTEYPPDAHRGLDAASSVVTVLASDGSEMDFGMDWRRSSSYRVYTPTLLVSMPTPDFSMCLVFQSAEA